MESTETNPLLETHPLPPFEAIRPEHTNAAVDQLIEDWREQLERALEGDSPADWERFAGLEERLSDRLDSAWSPVSHLHSVADSPEWREAYGEAVLKLSQFHTELNQREDRFAAYRGIRDGAAFEQLSIAQQRMVDNTLRDFRLSGIDLAPEQRQRFAEISQRLTELSTTFQQNLQDATDAWSRDFPDAEALDGLPEMDLAGARERARTKELDGYRINLEYPSYHAVMNHAHDRTLRRELYEAYMTRASDQGPHAGQWDNGPVLKEILALRAEQAKLVGYPSYVHYSLSTKMAEDPEQVDAFLVGLAARARSRAQQELAALQEFAREQGGPESLEPWDVGYYTERLRKARYDLSDEETRPYFPYPQVLEGMFRVARRLFGVEFRQQPASVWHDDVLHVQVLDKAGAELASMFIDPYAREGKRGGAWMGGCRSLRQIETDRWQRPVAFLTCNFPSPADGKPSLLSHNDVTTLFHEFGHVLHHLLTRIPHPWVGGISGVEWDAVELPSQFLENWCWQPEALNEFARHVDTGEALPEALFQRMLDARHFQSGLFLCRQLEFALTDLALHAGEQPVDVAAVQQRVRDQVSVVRWPEWSRFLNGFGHLFAGGYAAGYYSYLWAEQLAADAFSRFEEEGVFNPDTGAAFRREVLEVGGSRDAIESFRAFRGRDPEIGPLLRSYGIES